MLIKQGLF